LHGTVLFQKRCSADRLSPPQPKNGFPA
jgi:hypothetical protein